MSCHGRVIHYMSFIFEMKTQSSHRRIFKRKLLFIIQAYYSSSHPRRNGVSFSRDKLVVVFTKILVPLSSRPLSLVLYPFPVLFNVLIYPTSRTRRFSSGLKLVSELPPLRQAVPLLRPSVFHNPLLYCLQPFSISNYPGHLGTFFF